MSRRPALALLLAVAVLLGGGGGGALAAAAEVQAPIECEGDACQALPPPPEDPTIGTLVPGPANPPVHFPGANGKKPKHPGKKPKRGKGNHPRRHR